jgi:aspartyl-tRNA synthetase
MSLNSIVQVTSTGYCEEAIPISSATLGYPEIRIQVYIIAEAGQQIPMQARNVERPVPVAGGLEEDKL